jgi:hypothetical protein
MKPLLGIFLILCPCTALAESFSTTSFGVMNRTVSYQSPDFAGQSSNGSRTTNEALSGSLLCERVASPTSFGLEFGAGMCLQTGGVKSFLQSLGGHVNLLWYPLVTRTATEGDVGVRTRVVTLANFYLIGMFGFSKITHAQSEITNVTITSDTMDFGGGIGWSYRLFSSVSLGAEATYLNGSIMSEASTGSSTAISAGGVITVSL